MEKQNQLNKQKAIDCSCAYCDDNTTITRPGIKIDVSDSGEFGFIVVCSDCWEKLKKALISQLGEETFIWYKLTYFDLETLDIAYKKA
jgi:hypothetical protein